MEYNDYLKDIRWQKKRLKILSRDKYKCRLCKIDTGQMQVHHLFYYGKPWEIDNKWLITVCPTCHKKLESEKGQPLKLTDKDYQRMYRKMNRNRKEK